MSESNDKDKNVASIDFDLSLYDLTQLFSHCYKYHNTDCLVEYQCVTGVKDGKPKEEVKTLARFPALRRIHALALGSRPFMGSVGIPKSRPNVSTGLFQMLTTYLKLPYQSVFSDGTFTKISINKKLKDKLTLSDEALKAQDLAAKEQPNIESNREIAQDTTTAFNEIMQITPNIIQCHDVAPTRMIQDGFVAFLHEDPDLGYSAEPIDALDLITEPLCEFNPKTWSIFFRIKKMTAREAMDHIKEEEGDENSPWNTDALRWCLEEAGTNRGILNSAHYNSNGQFDNDPSPIGNENYQVKSYYSDKSRRMTDLNGYYGTFLTVEAYYKNTKGKVNKVIFFPSTNFDVKEDVKENRKKMSLEDLKKEGLDKADVIFKREVPIKCLSKKITVIPFDRSELTLERQRSFGHELFNPCEVVARIESAMLNTLGHMSTLYTRQRNQSGESDASNPEDLNINVNGETQDLSDYDIVGDTPFGADLNGMGGIRSIFLQHCFQKAFLGGLDGTETSGNGRGASLANLRLVRDGRVHKHNVEYFSMGLTEFYSKIYFAVLNLGQISLAIKGITILKRLFFDWLYEVKGHLKFLYEFDDDDIMEETGLPWWHTLQAVRNGASHFGAAEIVLYSEIKNLYGDSLDQQATQNLSRMGMRSLLGSQDAIDILGDPRDNLITQNDQIYQAMMENATIMGSVSTSLVNYVRIPVRDDKDDHVSHLRDSHNPKMKEMIDILNQGEVSPQELQDQTEEQLDTRINLILKVAGIADHSALHLQNLARFGDKRQDINQLREETNALMQSSEGLLNSLQINLRAQKAKQQESALKLQNLSPENQAEQQKNQIEFLKIQTKTKEIDGKLAIANALRSQADKQHVDKQLTSARDRASKERIAQAQIDAQREQARFAAGKDAADVNLQAKDISINAALKNKDIDARKEVGLKQKQNSGSKAAH